MPFPDHFIRGINISITIRQMDRDKEPHSTLVEAIQDLFVNDPQAAGQAVEIVDEYYCGRCGGITDPLRGTPATFGRNPFTYLICTWCQNRARQLALRASEE